MPTKSDPVSPHGELIISGLNILSDNGCQTRARHALTAVTRELISTRRASLLSHALKVKDAGARPPQVRGVRCEKSASCRREFATVLPRAADVL